MGSVFEIYIYSILVISWNMFNLYYIHYIICIYIYVYILLHFISSYQNIAWMLKNWQPNVVLFFWWGSRWQFKKNSNHSHPLVSVLYMADLFSSTLHNVVKRLWTFARHLQDANSRVCRWKLLKRVQCSDKLRWQQKLTHFVDAFDFLHVLVTGGFL